MREGLYWTYSGLGYLVILVGVSCFLGVSKLVEYILRFRSVRTEAPFRPRATRNHHRHNNERRPQAFVDSTIKNAGHVVHPDVDSIVAGLRSDPAAPTSLFFGRLPYELRRDIMVRAFGGRTLHMHLRASRADRRGGQNAPLIMSFARPGGQDVKNKDWEWYGTVCHRREPDYGSCQALSRGRLRSWPESGSRAHQVDKCLWGDGVDEKWPENADTTCRMGVSGWLRTCRQAYLEGMYIFYTENTITICSPPLQRNLQTIVSPNITASLASLELIWTPRDMLTVALESACRPGAKSGDQIVPMFPSLVHLHLHLVHINSLFLFDVQGFGDEEDRQIPFERRLSRGLPPRMDRVVQIMAPATTEVFVSHDDWDWYKNLDTHLIRRQGLEVTKPQLCHEFQGLKCWRQIPLKSLPDAKEQPDGETSQPTPRGYWFHVVGMFVCSKRQTVADWEHQQLYNLEDHDLTYVLPQWKMMEQPEELLVDDTG